MCAPQTGVLFLSLSGSVRGNSNVYIKVYQQCWKEWASWCTQRGLPNTAISAPKLANVLLHLFQVGLAWHTICIYCSATSAFLEPHQIYKASNHSVIFKLMCHFYLQHPPSCKHFDLWDVEYLVSLLESWAPTSSLTTFKLACNCDNELRKNLGLTVINIWLIKNKDTNLLDHLVENKTDTCIVTETWLKEDDKIWLECCDLSKNGYQIHSANRKNRRGGRLVIISTIGIKITL